ncbi:DUF3127 domain-containing protein [Sphingobacterium bovisgrunnientis]|uniref:DUF3127 domain-containing protein n=1 Tax=Sphingobacterium bovisgrunnientis TaxID=1874697 RepID=UPI0013582F16|nr:DUF3127 domain-containing protein [Sphingobacterium bovisgrunnientis]
MDIKGRVHEIGPVQQVTDSFKKRELVLAYWENPQFVEYITFQAMQDRVSIFDNLKVGQDVSIDFNIKGRPWTNKDGATTYFNSLVAWRVSPLSNQQPATNTDYSNIPAPVDISGGADDDDLPF